MGAVEQPVQERDERPVGRGVVDRRGHHQPVCSLELGGRLVDRIVKDAAAQFGAAAAGDAAADGLGADLDGLGLDALLCKNFFHFCERNARIAPGPGAAVDHKDFHGLHLAWVLVCFVMDETGAGLLSAKQGSAPIITRCQGKGKPTRAS